MGFIAQEVNEVFPECVSSPKDDHWAVAYSELGAYAIGALKELRSETQNHDAALEKRVDDLTRENTELKEQLAQLLQRMSAIENQIQ